jgi:hypothetical protein
MPEPLQTAYNKVNIVDADGNLISFGGGGASNQDSATATNQEEIISELQQIKDNGTPITGAILPPGGSKLIGWLSAIWKVIVDRVPVPINGRVPVDVSSLSVTVNNAQLEIANDTGNPIPVTGQVESKTSSKYWREDFAGNALSSDWVLVQTGAGQSVTIANSELQIVSGTSPNAETIIERNLNLRSDTRATICFLFRISARINNQEIIFELNDGAGNSAQWIFSGTNSRVANISCSNNGSSIGVTSISSMADSLAYSIAQIEIKDGLFEFTNLLADSNGLSRQTGAVRNRQIPEPNSLSVLKLRIRIRNLTPVPSSSTTTFIDAITLSETQKLLTDISGGFGGHSLHNSIPCNILQIPNVYPLNSVIYFTQSIFPLAANASFTGGNRDTSLNPRIVIYCLTDQAGTLILEGSPDNSTWLNCGSFAVSANQPFELSKVIALKFYRLRYANGATAQTSFRLYSSQIAI